MTGPAIDAASFKNLIIRANAFVDREKAPITLKMRGATRAQLGSGLLVDGNEWMTQNGIPEPSLLCDADTCREIVCKENRLVR